MTDTRIVREPLTGPAAWRGEDLTPPDYLYPLSAEEISAIEAVRDDLTERGIGLGQIGPDTVAIPGMEAAVIDWLDRLENGIGFVIVRGLDIDGWTERQAGLTYYALGRHMGFLMPAGTPAEIMGPVADARLVRGDLALTGTPGNMSGTLHGHANFTGLATTDLETGEPIYAREVQFPTL